MKVGKAKCKVLKGIRKKIAEANDISYNPRECHHKGDCAGTCPACEAEVRYLTDQLNLRRMAGKAVRVAGLAAGITMLSSCRHIFQPNGMTERDFPPQSNKPELLEGDVVAPDTVIVEPRLLVGDVVAPEPEPDDPEMKKEAKKDVKK